MAGVVLVGEKKACGQAIGYLCRGCGHPHQGRLAGDQICRPRRTKTRSRSCGLRYPRRADTPVSTSAHRPVALPIACCSTVPSNVVAIDSGTNQLVWRLRTDERVDVRENTNARELKPDDFTAPFDLIVMDVSFISATKILAALVPLLTVTGRIVILIKPQFEVGRGEVGKGGIVKAEKHERVVTEVNNFAESCGLTVIGVIESPIWVQRATRNF